jgi:hypothetical protein
MKTALLAAPLVFALLSAPYLLAADQPAADWLPAGVEQLGKSAAFHTDFTFDRTMLQLAGGLVDGGDEDTRRAIAKLNGITVHLYRYGAPGMYDAGQLEAIRQQYKMAGWKHLVNTGGHAADSGPASMAPPLPTAPGPYAVGADGHTDLYIKFQGTDVVGMVVLQSGPRNLNVIALSGDLSPLDLLHLRGHFGIPRFAGDQFTPTDN